jgi:predicted GNAT family acetyltransferase
MVKAALEYAKAEDLEVLPICPFVKGYLRKHPEYLPLVSEKYRTGL